MKCTEPGFSDEETLAVCVRCRQIIVARNKCPYCSGIQLLVREEHDPNGIGGTWMFELRLEELDDKQPASPILAVIVGGFASPAVALAEALAVLRRGVADLRERNLTSWTR